MTNNKIFLSMAALVFVGAMTAGCSSDDLTAETPQPADAGKTVVMKTTISLSESASTRALDANGKKTFAAGDQIAVIYKNTAGETVKAESAALQATDLHDAAKTASFSVTLTNPQASTPVRYIYPASMASATVATDVATNDDVTINYAALATQDGTLASLASDLDLAVFDGTLTAQAVLPPATLENPLTIGKFTIKNNATSDDVTNTITKLIIGDGTNTYTVNSSTLSTIYVAMKPIASTQTVTVKAITDNNKYIKSVTGNTLAKNTMYPINVSMTARYPLAVTATSVSSEDIGSVIGADGNIYLNAAAATAATPATTALAIITYVGAAGTADASSTGYKGLALALSNANSGNKAAWCSQCGDACLATQYNSFTKTNDMAGIANTNALIDHGSHTHTAASAARNYNRGIHPTGTSAWFLPSAGQWDKMVTAAGGYSTLMTNAGLQPDIYWSSTEYSGDEVWEYSFDANNYGIGWGSDNKSDKNFYIRSALAF